MKNKILKILFAVLLVCLYSFRLWQTTGCKQFNGFYFNPISVKINVESERQIDKSSPEIISKFVYNKALDTPYEIILTLTKIWNASYLLETLSPLGLLLLITSALSAIKNKSKFGIGAMVLIVTLSFLVIFKTDSKNLISLQNLMLYGFTFLGTKPFLKSRLKIVLFVGLFIYSLWFFAVNWQMPIICHEIFFN